MYVRGCGSLKKTSTGRLLEKWLYDGLAEDEEEPLPQGIKDKTKAYFRRVVDEVLDDVKHGT